MGIFRPLGYAASREKKEIVRMKSREIARYHGTSFSDAEWTS